MKGDLKFIKGLKSSGGGGGLVAKSCSTLVTPWTVDYQAPRSMEFPRQEYWSWVAFLFPGDLPDPGIEPAFPACRWSAALKADSLLTEPPGKPKII